MRYVAAAKGLAALSLVLLAAPAASAQGVPTCVQVRATALPRAERQALEQLVRNEVLRHRTHQPVAHNCATHLRVELLELDGRRYLTGRVDLQVPVRVEVDEGLEAAVVELLRIVLGNDPVALEDPEVLEGFGGAMRRLRRGYSLWQVELRQALGMLQGRPFALSGLSLGFRREVHRFALEARLAATVRTGKSSGTRTRPVAFFEASVGGRWFVAPWADTSLYAGASVGLVHHWLRGPLASRPELIDTVHVTGLAAGVRLGLEVLRTTTHRLDLFAEASLPAFVTADETAEVVDAWLPTAVVGAGLAM